MPSADHPIARGRPHPVAPAADPVAIAGHRGNPLAAGAARAVGRALGELRRGSPVLIDGDAPLVAVAAETATPDALAEAAAIAGTGHAALMVLPSARAALLRTGSLPTGDDAGPPVALALAGPLDHLPAGTGRDDRPDAVAGTTAVALPPGAAVGLALLKRARLLPVLLGAAAANGAAGRARLAGAGAIDGDDAVAGLAVPPLFRAVASAPVPLRDAPDARLVAFRPDEGGPEHTAIVIGEPERRDAPLVRLHSECFTGDTLGSLRCDCGDQLRAAIRMVAAEGAGVVIYLPQEGRGIGLVNKLRAYRLQDRGLDTLDANRALGFDGDERAFGIAAGTLRALGIDRVRLLTNNPDKLAALADAGVTVVAHVGLAIAPNGVNDGYLATKRTRFGHLG